MFRKKTDENKPLKKQNPILRVLDEKHKASQRIRQKKQGAIKDIKQEATYRARLSQQLTLVDDLFQDDNITSFVISVDKKDITSFLRTLHQEEMGAYDITQLDAYTFEIAKKTILM